MTTNINIASNALILIGDNPISSFDDPGAGAQTAAAIYTITKKSILSEHPWTFALKEQFLNRLTQTPDTETNYQYAYQLPVDLIRIWKVMCYSNYDVVGDKIFSNQDTLLCRYTYDVSETKLPPQFIKALEYKLASEFSLAVTEDINKADFYEKKYLRQIALARSVDSQGHPQVSIVDSPFTAVRLGGGGLY